MAQDCNKVYDDVYKREKAAGSNEIKARAYATVAKKNCIANPGDVHGKPDK
jgi:hypothetical protein